MRVAVYDLKILKRLGRICYLQGDLDRRGKLGGIFSEYEGRWLLVFEVTASESLKPVRQKMYKNIKCGNFGYISITNSALSSALTASRCPFSLLFDDQRALLFHDVLPQYPSMMLFLNSAPCYSSLPLLCLSVPTIKNPLDYAWRRVQFRAKKPSVLSAGSV